MNSFKYHKHEKTMVQYALELKNDEHCYRKYEHRTRGTKWMTCTNHPDWTDDEYRRDPMYDNKSCPFCNADPSNLKFSDMTDDGQIQLVCSVQKHGCGASTAWCYSEEAAIAAWNRRVK